jgi:hypothetical protein
MVSGAVMSIIIPAKGFGVHSFTKVPLSELTPDKIIGGTYDIMTDFYWAVTEDDCVLFYRGRSAQCNRNKGIVERIVARAGYPPTRIEFIPIAYLKHNCSDYIFED